MTVTVGQVESDSDSDSWKTVTVGQVLWIVTVEE